MTSMPRAKKQRKGRRRRSRRTKGGGVNIKIHIGGGALQPASDVARGIISQRELTNPTVSTNPLNPGEAHDYIMKKEELRRVKTELEEERARSSWKGSSEWSLPRGRMFPRSGFNGVPPSASNLGEPQSFLPPRSGLQTGSVGKFNPQPPSTVVPPLQGGENVRSAARSLSFVPGSPGGRAASASPLAPVIELVRQMRSSGRSHAPPSIPEEKGEGGLEEFKEAPPEGRERRQRRPPSRLGYSGLGVSGDGPLVFG